MVLLLCVVPGQRTVTADGLQITTFSADITPRLGSPVGQGFIPILTTAEHPLLARGIVLQDSGVTCVICTLDLMEVHNESYDFLRRSIGQAVGVSESHVALHCLHQHTAPAINTAALRLERGEGDPRLVATAEYLTQIAEKVSAAIQEARMHWRQVTHVGTGQSRVERVASSRRLELGDGRIQGRSSNTRSAPQLRQLPEGVIDPWVRTVAVYGADCAIAHLHYYASHPQSFYGDGRASYDVPGIVRERVETKTGVFQLYITGCAGDIAFGKYNDGSRIAREELTAHLQSGVESSILKLKKHPLVPMKWSVRPLTFPLRRDDEFTAAANQKILDDPTAEHTRRRKAAIALAWIQRVTSGKPVELSCLTIGPVKMLHLPGEPFVQYQLAAQNMQPRHFVCVAGYGDCGMGYIGGDRIYTDHGGYEQTYAFAGPCEELFLNTIGELLAVAR